MKFRHHKLPFFNKKRCKTGQKFHFLFFQDHRLNGFIRNVRKGGGGICPRRPVVMNVISFTGHAPCSFLYVGFASHLLTVSTCLVAMRLMSSVLGNISTDFDTFLCLRKHIQKTSVCGNISTNRRFVKRLTYTKICLITYLLIQLLCALYI